MRSTITAAVLLAALQYVKGQTFTSCNPLTNTSCPSDPALATTQFTDFTKGASSDWTLAEGTTLSYNSQGANFVINVATDAPTISSTKYIFFGNVQVLLKAAPGKGMVSSFILESDDLDEIDWEWLGSTDSSVESNFFGKGNTTTYDRAIYHPVATPIETFHNYTIDWTAERINWYIDSALVRTLNYGDALALGGRNYPQTPMRVKMGDWVGCASVAAETDPKTEGTCQWAGGAADFSAAPFTMVAQTVTITDYGCGTEYTYGDESGSWQSIKTDGNCGGSTGSSSSVSVPVSSSTASIPSSATTSVTSASSATSKSEASTSSSVEATKTTATGTSSATTVISTPTATGPDAGSGIGGSGIPAAGNSSSSTLSTATKPTGTNTTGPKSSSTSSSAGTSATIAPASAGNALSPKHKYGVADFAVVALGLGLGYLVM